MPEISIPFPQLVEVIGWFVLALLQVWILIRQADLTRKVEGYRFRTSRLVTQLQDFIDWATKGHKMVSYYATLNMRLSWAGEGPDSPEEVVFRKRIDKIGEDRLEWELSFYYYAGMAANIWDTKFKGESYDEMKKLKSHADDAFRVSTDEYQHVHSPENVPQPIRDLNKSYARLLAILEGYIQQATSE